MAQLENFRLKVFRAVAEQLSFRKAAEHLFLTQPAVTLQIKALENDLGARLFDRSANRITLTSHGKVLLHYANKISALASAAEQEVGSENGKFSGELSLGVSTTIAQYVLPRLIGAFLKEHPRIQLSVHSGNTEQVVDLLLDGQISIGLIEGPARRRGVHTEPFMRDELVLITPADSEPAHFSSQQLLASSLLMREQGSGSRHVVETALEKTGYKLKSFKRVMNLDSTEAIKSAVEAGLGIGFVSRWAIAKELELGVLRVVQVRGLQITRHFSLVTRSGPELQGPSEAFRIFALARGHLLSNVRKTRPSSDRAR
ncbi:MAG TPA: selenium metabolism-associated LysR family transcriptional regulator [Candidatus Binatia bacterium]|nr:selenium metabolism-associated LysR family transcriptional regulator [Candidatus Binatia bacterium]